MVLASLINIKDGSDAMRLSKGSVAVSYIKIWWHYYSVKCSDEDYNIVVETSAFSMKVFWLE